MERVVSTVVCDADADATDEEANQIEELVCEYFKKGPTHGFDNGFGHLLDELVVFLWCRVSDVNPYFVSNGRGMHHEVKTAGSRLSDPLHNLQRHGQKFRQQRRQQCRKIRAMSGKFR